METAEREPRLCVWTFPRWVTLPPVLCTSLHGESWGEMQRALGFCLVLQGPTNHMDEILLVPKISTQRITTPGIQEKGTLLFSGFLVEHQRTSQPGPCQPHQVSSLQSQPSLLPSAVMPWMRTIYFLVTSLPLPKIKSCSLKDWLNCYSLSEAFPSPSTCHTPTAGWINHPFICFIIDHRSESTPESAVATVGWPPQLYCEPLEEKDCTLSKLRVRD